RTLAVAALAEIAPPVAARACVARAMRDDGIDEVVFLVTCNRVEALLARRGGVELDRASATLGRNLGAREGPFAIRGEAAMRHVLSLAASLDSLVVGERQIVWQLRSAVADAEAAGTIGPRLRGLASEAFRVARRVHRETRLTRSTSVASLAVERLLARVHTPARIALVGAGAMTEQAAILLAKAAIAGGGPSLLFVNRTRSKAEALAGRFGGDAMALDAFLQSPPAIDALVTATSAPHAIFDHAALDRLARARRVAAPLVAVDLAVPFDVEPSAALRLGVERITIDELREEAERRAAAQAGEIDRARAIVTGRLVELEARERSRARGLALDAARRRGEGIARRMVAGLVEAHPTLPEALRRRCLRWAIEASHRIAHARAHGGARPRALVIAEQSKARAILSAHSAAEGWARRAALSIARAATPS
ncbi:MAG TPA: hypothetical protein VKE69_02750, partial [Planctomycetota bacterium]|nr:hypothetical protein [Planctomycetota bacterium]